MTRGSVAGLLLLLVVTACSGSGQARGAKTAPASPPPVNDYQQTVLADGAVHLWPLDDAAGAEEGAKVADVAGGTGGGRVVGPVVQATNGPLPGRKAVQFTGSGKVETRSTGILLPGRPFTMEFFFRADGCTRTWTQVAGNATYDATGRNGVNVLHYPKFFQSQCQLAVEFWGNGRFTGGCGTPTPTVRGRWFLFAMTYDGHDAQCFVDGHAVARSRVRSFAVSDLTFFGIGGSGGGYAGPLDSGSMADVALYKRALSGGQLARHALVAAQLVAQAAGVAGPRLPVPSPT